MAVTTESSQVQWSASDSVSVTAAGTQTSDAVTIPDTAFVGELLIKADNAAMSASSGDEIEVRILPTVGDPDGSGSDEYADSSNAPVVAVLDTNAVDPSLVSIPFPAIAAKSFKLHCTSLAASNAITVSAEARWKKNT